jgi:hypothetical protein
MWELVIALTMALFVILGSMAFLLWVIRQAVQARKYRELVRTASKPEPH